MRYFRLLRFIDKNKTLEEQIIYLKSYLLFGFPLGYFFTEIIKYFILKSEYHFRFGSLLVTIIIDLLIVSPFIINYFKYKRAYKIFTNKFNSTDTTKKIIAKFNYKEFTKGETYEVKYYVSPIKGKDIFIISNINERIDIELKSVINKFDLDNLKEKRLKKLKKLKNLW